MSSGPSGHQNLEIVFYDGVCALCHGAVNFILDHDKTGRFHFAPLQGETARELDLPDGITEGTLILYNRGSTHKRSDAALMIGTRLGGAWGALHVLWIFPKFARDLAYNFIARNRYRWFGQYDACRIPTKAHASRMLP